MQILIEIPEKDIPKKQDILDIGLHFSNGKVCSADGYGFMVLPKGHGDLKDADYLKSLFPDRRPKAGTYNPAIIRRIDEAPTIIEADNCEDNCEECEHNDGECCRILFERSYEQEPSAEKTLSWLGKNCKDCGNKKCKGLGELPKGYDCALWQSESEGEK